MTDSSDNTGGVTQNERDDRGSVKAAVDWAGAGAMCVFELHNSE